MTERPIIFSGPMVCAILAGRKTMTRRLATSPLRKCEPGDLLWVRETLKARNMDLGGVLGLTEPPTALNMMRGLAISYAADDEPALTDDEFDLAWAWRRPSVPAIHMPRWASRITLRVTGVKVERLQQITDEDAIAEGAIEYRPTQSTMAGQSLPPTRMYCFGVDSIEGTRFCDDRRAKGAFELLWRSLQGHDSWDANPEVVAISFERRP